MAPKATAGEAQDDDKQATPCTRSAKPVGAPGGSDNVNRFASSISTMRTRCSRLACGSWKLLVSLAMEGKFSREGLQSLEEDDDILTAMARELVTQEGVGESADEVWRQIQAEHPTMQVPRQPLPNTSEAAPAEPLIVPALDLRYR